MKLIMIVVMIMIINCNIDVIHKEAIKLSGMHKHISSGRALEVILIRNC